MSGGFFPWPVLGNEVTPRRVAIQDPTGRNLLWRRVTYGRQVAENIQGGVVLTAVVEIEGDFRRHIVPIDWVRPDVRECATVLAFQRPAGVP